MATVIAVHEVDDVAHWLRSPKRAEFFGPRGMRVRTFVSPGGGSRVGLIVENVPKRIATLYWNAVDYGECGLYPAIPPIDI